MSRIDSIDASLRLRGTPKFDEMNAFQVSQSRHTRNVHISLKQWKMFHAVVDCDGFSGAASHLHISQSAISYTLAKLQEQLGVSLLKLEGRKAQLTEEGKILLERSRELVRNAVELESIAENLRQGWGPEIRLAVDPSFPSQLIMLSLHELSPCPLNIKLKAVEATMDQAKKALHERSVDLAVTTQVPLGYISSELIEIEYIAAAHPDHPLFALQREITTDDLDKQMQIVISGSNDYVAAGFNYQLPRHARLWNVSGFDTAVGALRHCLGYAWLPKYRVHRWIEQNQIRILPLRKGTTYRTNLYLIFARSLKTDSAAKRFADVLLNVAAAWYSKENLEHF